MATNQWTIEEQKIFEQSLAIYTEKSPNRWENIALWLNKTVDEVKNHYEAFYFEILKIEYGLDEVPSNNMTGLDSTNPISLDSKQGDNNKRKRGNPWSEDEHRLFLIGLEIYGKGDWRGISRNVVVTRTATQVASHAQKYFNRQKLRNNEKKRLSIHDITLDQDTSESNHIIVEDISLAMAAATNNNMDWIEQHDETSIPLQLEPCHPCIAEFDRFEAKLN